MQSAIEGQTSQQLRQEPQEEEEEVQMAPLQSQRQGSNQRRLGRRRTEEGRRSSEKGLQENSPDPVEPNVPDVVPLGQSIPTMKLLAAFPRWTLKARSNFSWILARTFSLRCRGHAGPRFCFRGLSAPFDGLWTFPVEWPQAMWSEVEVHRFAEDLTCRDRGSQLLAQRLPAF